MLATRRKCEACDRGRVPAQRAHSLLPLAVPYVDAAVGAARRERAVHGVEGDRVDRVDRFDAIYLGPVAFEGVLALLKLLGDVPARQGTGKDRTGDDFSVHAGG